MQKDREDIVFRNDIPAVQFMIMDIIEQTLAHAENPVWLAQYLTQQIRSLIGGKIVVLLGCNHTPDSYSANSNKQPFSPKDHRIISVCPSRHTKRIDIPELQLLANFSHKINRAQIWSPNQGEHEVQSILQKIEWGVSVVLPLNLGAKRFGLLLVIDLLNLDRLEDTLQMLEMMPNVIALVLKNSLMYEELENIVKERTSELAAKTDELAAQTNELRAITKELEKTNEELERLNNELEERVKRRTAELEASNRELRAFNRELEAFCYSVSHDLRTPLRGIDGWSFALAEDFEEVLGEQGHRYIDQIRAEAHRMGQLIDDLLKLSRITRSEMVITPINISKLAASVVERYNRIYNQNRAQITIEPNLTAYGDIGMVDIVLTNLIDNAFKFTSKSPLPKIEFGKLKPHNLDNLKTTQSIAELESKNRQIFYVKDNGAGFNMAHYSKMFGSFQRLHKVTEFEGNGVGLAIVDRIIQRHGGKVWAEGKVNQGAIFYFTL